MARVLKIHNGYQPPRNSRKKLWLIAAALVLFVLLILNSSIFSLKHVEIEGNTRVSDEKILEDLELEMGTNLFRYMLTHLNAEPKVDPRLSAVDIYFSWPNTIRIKVDESMTIGYVYFQGTYLCIDRKGHVATSTYTLDEDLPIIKGIEVGSFSLGESLDTKDTQRYEAVVSVCAILRKHDLNVAVSEVNVRNLEDIVLYTEKLEIHLGGMKEMEQKIGVIGSILEKPEIPAGILHIEDLDQQVYIEPKVRPGQTPQ